MPASTPVRKTRQRGSLRPPGAETKQRKMRQPMPVFMRFIMMPTGFTSGQPGLDSTRWDRGILMKPKHGTFRVFQATLPPLTEFPAPQPHSMAIRPPGLVQSATSWMASLSLMPPTPFHISTAVPVMAAHRVEDAETEFGTVMPISMKV